MGIYQIFLLLVILGLIAGGLFLCIILAWIYVYGLYNKRKISTSIYDNVLVLGARVGSPNFILRLKLGSELADNASLKFTGTEKECIAANEYFQKSLPSKDISFDSLARNTWDNIANNHEFISNKTVVVTNDFHVLRTRLICRKQGLSPIIYSKDNRLYIKSYIREIFALLKYFGIQFIKIIK